MKFLRPLFLKHISLCCVFCAHAYAYMQVQFADVLHILPRNISREVAQDGGEQGKGWGEFGPPQKLICNFNIPLFIPIKSAVQRFNGRLRRGGATHRVQVSSRLSHYGQQCITADLEFMGLHWIQWNAETCKYHRGYWRTFFIKFACPCTIIVKSI